MSTAPTDTEGVHRLLDMVVEEVSLVDRAANQHRFLIVKRDDAMDDTTQVRKAPGGDEGPTSPGAATGDVPDGSPLGAALAALESLTAIVDLLGSLGADRSDTRLAALAQQLRATAEQILVQTGFPIEPDAGAEAVDARAKAAAPSSSPPSPSPADSTLEQRMAAAKSALARFSELAAKGLKPKEDKPEAPPPGPELSTLKESLAKLTESLRTLSDTVKEQQQRLGRVEKHFGLPNSAPPAERVSKAANEEVGWPMDLNKPMDRENVDKSVSFHDP